MLSEVMLCVNTMSLLASRLNKTDTCLVRSKWQTPIVRNEILKSYVTTDVLECFNLINAQTILFQNQPSLIKIGHS
jgi:hypothetical protein